MGNISKLRKDAGMTQTELAALLGVKENTMSQYEAGKRFPKRKILIKLAEILKCTVDKIVKE